MSYGLYPLTRLAPAAFAATVLALAASLAACGSPAAPKSPAEQAVGDLGVDLAGLNSKLPPFIDSVGAGQPSRAFSGYVLVAQHDKPIFSRGYAVSDREKHTPNTADTSFRVGSVTKQFTAAAILRLEQDGKLSVNDPISKHLPEYPAVGKDVTIHQLLTHTSGIPSYTDDPAIMSRRAQRFTVPQLLALFWDKPLVFAPGSRFAYSNSGYIVLGAIIESASGKPYATYLAETLFLPAGMTRTVVGDAESATDRAEGYQLAGDKLEPADPIDMSVPYAAGAVRSTANDLVRWHRALEGDQILGAAAKAKLYKPALNDYAYGWVAKEVEQRPTVRHGGGIDGFSTMYWRVPAADLVVVAWSNVLGVAAEPVGHAAVVAALGGTPKPAEQGK
jgi:D-alanyl-D-alanine carboxypeptidase